MLTGKEEPHIPWLCLDCVLVSSGRVNPVLQERDCEFALLMDLSKSLQRQYKSSAWVNRTFLHMVRTVTDVRLKLR